jgi:hypothetical protein
MKSLLALAALALAATAGAQSAPTAAADPWAGLAFLEGSWSARAAGPGGATIDGRYEFRRELGGHVLSRHTLASSHCSGPADFDCLHSDQLVVFQEHPGQPLKALYLDNEGHAIHYLVSTPAPGEAVFLSEDEGPRFRLSYRLDQGTLAGRFQVQPPGQAQWHSVLEWSGTRQ